MSNPNSYIAKAWVCQCNKEHGYGKYQTCQKQALPLRKFVVFSKEVSQVVKKYREKDKFNLHVFPIKKPGVQSGKVITNRANLCSSVTTFNSPPIALVMLRVKLRPNPVPSPAGVGSK